MTIAPIAPIRRVVSVPTSQQRASEVFTQQITSWWPADHHIGSAPIEEIVVEPREGGRWYTRHRDGTETSTGYVSIWRPYDRLALTWQIGADWRYDPKLLTIVELRFVAEAPDRTRVELEHRDLENFGPDAPRMRQIFDAPDAWKTTLTAFANGPHNRFPFQSHTKRGQRHATPTPDPARLVNWYLCQLLPPRPDFATSMTDDEHSTMGRHVHYWSEVLAAGQATIFSPVSDPAGGWGMAVVRAAAEDEVRALGDADPAVVERVARYDVLSLPGAMTAAPGQVK